MKKIFMIFLYLLSVPAFATFSENVIGGCDAVHNFFPRFVPNSYTCDSGYFLPANTAGCVVCPNGYECPGGTFLADNYKSQGIERKNPMIQNTNNTCSSNFVATNKNNVARLYPRFEPNTINVNFDDGNGNVTSMTCEYGDTITIPDTVPTRTGYNFTGWKVRTEE